jgi:hypothetical protein
MRALSSAVVSRPLAIGMGIYAALLVSAVVVLNTVHHPPLALTVILAVLPPAAATAAILGQRRQIRGREGIERTVLTEATSLSFYATALSALAYGFLESWAGAPHLSMLWVYFYAMAVWALLSVLLGRSFR